MSGAPSPSIDDLPDRRFAWLRLVLLAVWASVSFGVSYFARDWIWPVDGEPFSYWMAAQGAVLVFIVIVVFYAWFMNRLERQVTPRSDA